MPIDFSKHVSESARKIKTAAAADSRSITLLEATSRTAALRRGSALKAEFKSLKSMRDGVWTIDGKARTLLESEKEQFDDAVSRALAVDSSVVRLAIRASSNDDYDDLVAVIDRITKPKK